LERMRLRSVRGDLLGGCVTACRSPHPNAHVRKLRTLPSFTFYPTITRPNEMLLWGNIQRALWARVSRKGVAI
jgi:hypothetical protein